MHTLKEHTAAGQALGYYFQLQRALSWLAKAPKGSTVGIETEDDVVTKLSKGEEIYEQDKSSTTTFPFNPTRIDLWKTLDIWLTAIQNNEIDIKNSTFYMVTNKCGKGTFVEKLGCAKSKDEIEDCITEIRKLGVNSSVTTKKTVDKVLSFSNEQLYALFSNIRFKDGSEMNAEKLKNDLISDLQLDTDDYVDNIINELTGWVFQQVVSKWKNKEPAIIDRDSFIRMKNNVIRDKISRIFDEQVEEVSKEKQDQEMDSLYVQQLKIVRCEYEEIRNAIIAYINASKTITELAEAGIITMQEYENMKNHCRERWDIIFRRNNVTYENQKCKEEIGKINLYDTCEYSASLGNHKPQNYYLTQGTYHALANKLHVGWHPDFKEILGGIGQKS